MYSKKEQSNLQKVLLRGLLGFMVGVFISVSILLLISCIIGDGIFCVARPELIEETGGTLNAFALQYVLGGILGTACGAGSVVFEVERWSLTKKTILHLLIMSLSMFPIAYICRWMSRSVWGVISYFGIFLLLYAVIWVVQYHSIKKNIARINQKMANR